MHFGVMRMLEDVTQYIYNCGLFTFIYSTCVFMTLLFLYPLYMIFYCCIPKKIKIAINFFIDNREMHFSRVREYTSTNRTSYVELDSVHRKKEI